jgi:hypothetical protein
MFIDVFVSNTVAGRIAETNSNTTDGAVGWTTARSTTIAGSSARMVQQFGFTLAVFAVLWAQQSWLVVRPGDWHLP